jgi:hypothetical protein
MKKRPGTKKRPNTGQRSDAKALGVIAAAGWKLVHETGRYVAAKTIHEKEDESTTHLYESAFTLEALAKQVQRREAEESR